MYVDMNVLVWKKKQCIIVTTVDPNHYEQIK